MVFHLSESFYLNLKESIMTLPLSGTITLSAINVELGKAANAQASFNDSDVRTLLAKATGQISLADGYGKSAGKPISKITITAHTKELSITPASVSGYVAGNTNIEITINSGIYVWSDNNTIAGLTFSGFVAGDEATVINNGYIIGRGGDGADWYLKPAKNGGPAIKTNIPIKIINNGYIAGGGGGGGGMGGGTYGTAWGIGGGGAGGGAGGGVYGSADPAGGAIGQTGSNGYSVSDMSSAGGGGRILPGVGGAGRYSNFSMPGLGGGAGGSGSVNGISYAPELGGGGGGWGAQGGYSGHGDFLGYGTSGAGGSANNPGGNGTGTLVNAGGLGGKAVSSVNGNTITIISGSSTIYGALG